MAEPITDNRPRCGQCNKLMAELLTRPWKIRCGRCKTVWVADVLKPAPV